MTAPVLYFEPLQQGTGERSADGPSNGATIIELRLTRTAVAP